VTDGGKVFAKIPAYQYRGLHARLALWGLAEELLHVKRDGHGQTRSGQWRPTQKGMQWLSGMTLVPSEVYVQQGRVECPEGMACREARENKICVWPGSEN